MDAGRDEADGYQRGYRVAKEEPGEGVVEEEARGEGAEGHAHVDGPVLEAEDLLAAARRREVGEEGPDEGARAAAEEVARDYEPGRPARRMEEAGRDVEGRGGDLEDEEGAFPAHGVRDAARGEGAQHRGGEGYRDGNARPDIVVAQGLREVDREEEADHVAETVDHRGEEHGPERRTEAPVGSDEPS